MEEIKEKECTCSETCTCGDDCHCNENDKCSEECTCGQDKKKKKKEKKDKEVDRLKEENKELLAKVQYAQAELINYRKRKEEEVENRLKFANQDIISELIPVLDNFERAIKLDDNNLTDELSKFLAGFKMMYASLNDILKTFGVEEIDCENQAYNANEMQALMTDSDPNRNDEEILEVLLKGYKLKGRVIRPASVKVNKIEKGEMNNE